MIIGVEGEKEFELWDWTLMHDLVSQKMGSFKSKSSERVLPPATVRGAMNPHERIEPSTFSQLTVLPWLCTDDNHDQAR